jgi:tetratricopeptide (TPR) repeat protein
MFKRGASTDIWAWVNKDGERLQKKGGLHRAIVENYDDFWTNYDNDYVAAELSISQALEAAKATGELKWQLHLRHWRLQLWHHQRQVSRALPEAVDLLSMATDPRLRDVPQRICAYHDVVECYIEMDPTGYHQDIVANSQDILAQLPKRHPCATCARSHLAYTSAAVGKVEDAQYWLNQTKATVVGKLYAGLVIEFARISQLAGNLDDAERYYLEVRDMAQKEGQRGYFVSATLNLVRVYLEKSDLPKALDMLQNAQRNMKYQGNAAELAKLAEVEGRVAVAIEESQRALNYLKRSAQLYYDLGCYRDAADAALYAGEVARNAQIELPDEILDLAARAVGAMPPTSKDVYQKLADLGRQPIEPSPITQKSENLSAEELERKELSTLQKLLQEHIEQGQYPDVCMTLCQLASWHGKHNELRASVDYLIADAAIERLLTMPLEDREDALEALKGLREELPAGTIETALTAGESGPPSWLLPFFSQLPVERWAWVMRGIAAEVADRPFVEPEPDFSDNEGQFGEWLEYVTGMAALILRFHHRCEPSEFETFIQTLNGVAEEVEKHPNLDDPDDDSGKVILAFVHGMAALVRGSSVEEVMASVPPPFNEAITQIVEVAKQPVWFHPGSSPLDFLIEQAAQKAVHTLRQDDEYLSLRLSNLALRYKLMEIDLREQEPLIPMANFLNALRELVLLEGKQLPPLQQPLETPFDTILAAVFESAQGK